MSTIHTQGKILLATPVITGYAFEQTVIYVHTDDDSGSIGVMLNVKMEHGMATRFAEDINWPHPDCIHLGGPVDPQLGYVIHSNDYLGDTSIRLNDKLSYTGGANIVNDIQRTVGPDDFVLMTGYCQWAPDQLATEVENGMWTVTEFDIDYFFNDFERDEGWEFAIQIAAENKTDRLLSMVDNV